jgi:hypothetical protein
MGYEATWSGQVTITPPIPANKPRDEWPAAFFHARGFNDILLPIVERATDVLGTFRRVIDTVLPAMSTFSGYNIESELRTLIAHWPDREFAGTITAFGPEGDHWRYVVADRQVVRQTAAVMWPDDPSWARVPSWRGHRGSFAFGGQRADVYSGPDPDSAEPAEVLLTHARLGVDPSNAVLRAVSRLPMSFEQAETLGLELLAAARAKGQVA